MVKTVTHKRGFESWRRLSKEYGVTAGRVVGPVQESDGIRLCAQPRKDSRTDMSGFSRSDGFLTRRCVVERSVTRVEDVQSELTWITKSPFRNVLG